MPNIRHYVKYNQNPNMQAGPTNCKTVIHCVSLNKASLFPFHGICHKGYCPQHIVNPHLLNCILRSHV